MTLKLMPELKKAVDQEQWPVYLYGESGRGKSFAMAAIYVAWIGNYIFWSDMQSLLKRLMRCRMAEDGVIYEDNGHGQSVDASESSILDSIERADLACFDDIGLRSLSDAMYDAFYEIVNRRHGKPTIYTGNVTPTNLEVVYDSRIASRLLSGKSIEMTGEDRRLANATFVRL